MQTALAWKNLSGDVRRFLLGASGVGFAVVLMFMQLGFLNALLDSPVQMFDAVEGDLIARNSSWYSLISEKRFSKNLVTRAGAHPQVQWVSPIYFEKATTRIRVDEEKARAIRVIALPNDRRTIKDNALARKLDLLQQPMSAIVDVRSKAEYGFRLDDANALFQQRVELMDRQIRVIDTFKIGTDFANDGNILVSEGTFSRCFPYRGGGDPLAEVDFALIKLKEGADFQAVANDLTNLGADQWLVQTREDVIGTEVNFWSSQTPIGMIFYVGVGMGFAVGVIVCYQILYTNIHDSMSELATLKAMGYRNSYFLGFVVRQSFFLSIAGFLPALIVSRYLFFELEQRAGLPMLMDVPRAARIYGLTLAMCVTSGLLAVRRLWNADPASLF